MRRSLCVIIGAVAVAVTACSGPSDNTPDFRPSPTDGNVEGSAGVHVDPIEPTPSLGGGGGGGPGGSGSGNSSAAGQQRRDPDVVATRLRAPVGLSLLPDGTALVGERTTGRIVRVQPEAGQPVPTVRTLRGLDTSGDGGLLDLAVSPNYPEDNLVYAYITTPKDNRVVDFTLHGPVTPVLTGIPRGRTDNTGRIAFTADGNLYIGTGDAGRPSLANDPSSLAGKILRVDAIGSPVRSNPSPSSPVFSTGHRIVNGLCPVPGTTQVLDVEAGVSGAADEVNLLAKGGNYGWPRTTAAARPRIAALPTAAASPGDCAVQGSRLWVTSLDGRALFSAVPRQIDGRPGFGRFTAVLTNRYGRLKTVVAAQDGALWLTTSNRDGHGKPVRADERVIRYKPAGGGAGSTT